MPEPIESKKLADGRTVKIYTDDAGESPRQDDNLGTMGYVRNRRGYVLGDKQMEIEELEKIWNNDDKYISLKVFIYDHSGITVSTTPFSCPWDSCQCGVIFVEKKKVRKEYGWKTITKKRREQILNYLNGEVETFDKYVTGQVYGYVIEEANGEESDSCWGFYDEPKEIINQIERGQL